MSQFERELGRRGILFQRMLGIVRYVGNDAPDIRTGDIEIGGDQYNPCQTGVEHAQVVETHGTAIPHQSLFTQDHVQHGQVGRCPDVLLHQCQMCCSFHGAFLTGDDAVLHRLPDHGTFGSQITFQILFILGPNIQSSAQRLELFDRYSQLLYFKPPDVVGPGDKCRVAGKYFALGKILQRRVK
ncbi:hypothetical protein D3C86_977420 [compost metagenome]